MKSKEKKVLATPELLAEMESLKVLGGNMPDETQKDNIGLIVGCKVNTYCPGNTCPPPPPSYAPETCGKN